MRFLSLTFCGEDPDDDDDSTASGDAGNSTLVELEQCVEVLGFIFEKCLEVDKTGVSDVTTFFVCTLDMMETIYFCLHF